MRLGGFEGACLLWSSHETVSTVRRRASSSLRGKRTKELFDTRSDYFPILPGVCLLGSGDRIIQAGTCSGWEGAVLERDWTCVCGSGRRRSAENPMPLNTQVTLPLVHLGKGKRRRGMAGVASKGRDAAGPPGITNKWTLQATSHHTTL